MEDNRHQPEEAEESPEVSYVTPLVEDLDTSGGPAVTAAGKGSQVSG